MITKQTQNSESLTKTAFWNRPKRKVITLYPGVIVITDLKKTPFTWSNYCNGSQLKVHCKYKSSKNTVTEINVAMLHGPQQIFLISLKKATTTFTLKYYKLCSVENFSFWLNSDHEPLQYLTIESIWLLQQIKPLILWSYKVFSFWTTKFSDLLKEIIRPFAAHAFGTDY